MHTQETIEAVFNALLDPNADFLDAAAGLGIPITEFLSIAESPQITAAIEALERLARIRERALLARASHTAIAALERIADSDPETPGARETARKAAAQLLRMAPHPAPAPESAQAPDPAAPEPPRHPPESDPTHRQAALQAPRSRDNDLKSESRNPRSERCRIPAREPDAPNHANGVTQPG